VLELDGFGSTVARWAGGEITLRFMLDGRDPGGGLAGRSVGPADDDGPASEVLWNPCDMLCSVFALSGAFGAPDDRRGSRSDCLSGIRIFAVIDFVCLMFVFRFQSPL